MRCPRNPDHQGIKIDIQPETSPHYAGAYCGVATCRSWIKWLNEAQADDLMGIERVRNAADLVGNVALGRPVPRRPVRTILFEWQAPVWTWYTPWRRIRPEWERFKQLRAAHKRKQGEAWTCFGPATRPMRVLGEIPKILNKR